MQIPLILPQIVALDVVFALAACLQTIHVPLIASRRSSYNRKVICAYESSLVIHLIISAVVLFASSGSYLVAPLYVVAEAAGALLWLNAAIAAYGVVLMVHYRRPVMMVELLLVAPRRRRLFTSWVRRGPQSLSRRARSSCSAPSRRF